jgi:hypothetical protein
MNWLRHSFWFVPLLFASLALKFIGMTTFVEDENFVLQAAAINMRQHGFQVKIEPVGNGRLTVSRGACTAQLRLMDAHATADGFYRSTFRPSDKIAYIWRGRWSATRPLLGPLIEFYVKREIVRRGVSMHRAPLWIAGIDAQCGAEIPAEFSKSTLPMRPVSHRRVNHIATPMV